MGTRSAHGATAAMLVVAAAVLWGTTGTAQALLPPSTDVLRPTVVGLARLALGGAVLAGLTLLTDGRRWRTLAAARPATTAAIGALAVVAYHVAFFTGVARLGVALGTVLALGVAPLATGLGVALLEGRRPAGSWMVATATAIAGIALLLRPVGATRPSAVGVVLALAAGLSYAAYALASKRLLSLGVDGGTAMAALFGGGGLVAVLALVPSGSSALLSGVLAAPRGPGVLLWLGVATVAVSYRLYARGLADLEAERATTLTLAEPVTAAVLGVAVVGERLPATAIVGAGLVLVGLVVTAVSGAARSRSARPDRRRAGRPSGDA